MAGPGLRRRVEGSPATHDLKYQTQDPGQGSADRTVQARGRACACAPSPARTTSRSRSPPSGPDSPATRCGLPEPPRRLSEREAAIVRGHADSIALRLACHDPAVHRKARARRPTGARGIRSGRAGARRSHRLPAHGRCRQESCRHARRSFSSRQIRRDHRPCRRADRGRAGDDRARTAHRRNSAAAGAQARRAVAPLDRGARRPRSRSAGTRVHRSAPLRRRGARSARLSRHGRRSLERIRRGGRRGRRR